MGNGMTIIKTLKTMHKNSQERINSFKELLKDPTLTTNQRRSIAAKILGVHRRYKQFLIVEITTWALESDKSQSSKHKIEKWQEATFGRSITNNKLADWCENSRSPGERSGFDISEETTTRAKELFGIFSDAMKSEIDESRLRKLKGEILTVDLGM